MSRRGPTAAEIGKLGGKAGVGDVKRRSPEHYLKMAGARKKARAARDLAELREFILINEEIEKEETR